MALVTRRPKQVIHHSDQGSQVKGCRNTLKEELR